jgi:hypothetical protein
LLHAGRTIGLRARGPFLVALLDKTLRLSDYPAKRFRRGAADANGADLSQPAAARTVQTRDVRHYRERPALSRRSCK